MKAKIMAIGLGTFLLGLLACGQSAPETARAVLVNAQGVKIRLTVENLPPGGHAFHIHERGQCTPPDFISAGGHFNPFGKQHGLKNPQGPHAGDLPNIQVGPDGRATIEVLASLVTLKEGKNSLFQPGGTSLVIHEHADDEVSDPAGHAGPRLACGVIVR